MGAERVSNFCSMSPPFQPNVKANWGYLFPWNVQVSGTLQSIPGPEIRAQWTVPNALIAPTLGRNLSAGASGTKTIDLIEPGTMWGDRLNQVDLRVTKIVPIRTMDLELMVDLYNLFNAAPTVLVNTVYGSDWATATSTLQARFVKVGARLTF
jgi:hypothetical protein